MFEAKFGRLRLLSETVPPDFLPDWPTGVRITLQRDSLRLDVDAGEFEIVASAFMAARAQGRRNTGGRISGGS